MILSAQCNVTANRIYDLTMYLIQSLKEARKMSTVDNVLSLCSFLCSHRHIIAMLRAHVYATCCPTDALF